jgi:hypothetical protein
MSDTPFIDLMAECCKLGIQLYPVRDGLSVDAPEGALTPDLLDRLKVHKADIADFLREMLPEFQDAPVTPEFRDAPVTPEFQDAPVTPEFRDAPVTPQVTEANSTLPVCRCGATTWVDVPIHGGRSVRRDCGSCGRFMDFPVWYGKLTLPSEQ